MTSKTDLDIKDIYCDGISIGRSIGLKEGILEAIRVVELAGEINAAMALTKYYEGLLDAERKG